jgi:hypothetical protein
MTYAFAFLTWFVVALVIALGLCQAAARGDRNAPSNGVVLFNQSTNDWSGWRLTQEDRRRNLLGTNESAARSTMRKSEEAKEEL